MTLTEIAFLTLALTGGGCLLFCLLGVIAHIFRGPLNWVAGQLIREWWD